MRILALWLAVAGLAMRSQGAIPENDSFAARIAVFGTNVITTGSNVDATKEPGEPDPNFTGGRSVWWTWTAPANGSVTLSTAGSSFDTILSVFTGDSLPDLRLVAFNDTELATSTVTFNVTAGMVCQIAVDGTDNDSFPTNNNVGTIVLQLTLGPTQPPPANDHFAHRAVLSGSRLSNVQGSNVGATKEPGEPFHADVIGEKSVWWTWTAPASGALSLLARGSSTRGGALDTALAVYTGNSVSNLTFIAGNDEDDFGYESSVTCNVISNVTYQIAVDGFEGDQGSIRLDLDLGAPLPAPANDHFTNRITLSGTTVTTTATNVGASFEPEEPMHLVTFGGKSLWWRWTAPASGNVMVTTTNSAVDTLLAVYRGTALTNLVFVAGNDDATLSERTSLAYFNCAAGTQYQIAVDGYDSDSGSITLRLVYDSIADPVPANDNFANRTTLTGTNTTVTGSNIGATMEVGEPLHRGYYGGSSIWWRWTAPHAGIVTMDTSNSVPDTLLAVYTGSSLATLTEIASDNNSGSGNWSSRVSFPTESNVTYQIAVDGVDGDAGDLRLRVRLTQAAYTLTLTTNPPAAGAIAVSPLPDPAGRYAPGSVVTLTATPAGNSTFTSWSGDTSSTNNPLVLTMSSNKTITAEFYVPPTTKVWAGSHPQSGHWTTASNWEGGVAPIAGDDLIFPAGAARLADNTNNFPTNTLFRFLTFGGADYVLRGNPVRLTEGVVCTNDLGTNTVALDLLLGADQTFRCSNAAARLEISGGVNLSNRTLTVETAGQVSLSGVVSGAGGLIKTGGGTLALTGSNANTYAGMTVVNEGTLALGKAGVAVPGALTIGDGSGGADADVVRFEAGQQVSPDAVLVVNSSGLLNLQNFSHVASSLSGSGRLEFGGASAVLTVGSNNASSTFNGVITGDGQLVKGGNGTFTLTGNNTYTGQTTVSRGRLIVNGQQPDSAVVVNGPATLGGTGRVGSLSGAGTISPGLSPGMLSSGHVTLASDTTLRIELNGTSVGSGYDQLNVGGTVSLAGNLEVSLGFTPAPNDTFTIINNNADDAVAGAFNGLPEGGYLVTTSGVFQVNYAAGTGNDVVLTYVVPPQIACPPTVITNTAPGSCAQTVTFSATVLAGSPAPTVTYTLGTDIITSPHPFPVGTNQVFVIASNGLPTHAACAFLVVVDDSEPPALACPTNLTALATAGACPIAVDFAVEATDNCGLAQLTVTPPSGSFFPVGTNLVTVGATDLSDNTNTCSFTVTVLPGPPPGLSILAVSTNVVLSWSETYECYTLEYATELAPSSLWSNHTGPFSTNGGSILVTNAIGPANRYFRLKR
jgi:autotransporter-associated beta strand protein